MSSTPAVRLAAVTVVREGRVALDDVDWQVLPGEHWAVLGANGAGKSTLLQVAAGRLTPTRGTAEVLGEPVPVDDEVRSRIGVASAALGEWLPRGHTALDLVLAAAYGAIGRGQEVYDDTDRARALATLRRLGCGRLADRRYSTLSEGERQRVQVARALSPDPELLLLDEPAAALDLGAREALLRRLTRVLREPRAPATVLVTHRVEELPVGITHALLLAGGRVSAAGPVASVLTAAGLSAAFGFPLRVTADGGRWSARAAV